MCQNESIHSLLLKEVDILALLLDIGDIINCRRLLFLPSSIFSCLLLGNILCVNNLRLLTVLFALDVLDILRQCDILVIQILKDNEILHLLLELLILQAAKFDKRTDIIPVFLIILTINLVHTGQLVCYLFGNIIGNLFDKAIILKCTS